MNRMTTLRALAASTLALGLAACGGADSSAASSPAPSPSPAPAPAPAFSITLDTDKAIVLQGASASLHATLHRDAGFTDAVQVTLGALPAGVSAGPVQFAAGSSEATVVLSAAAAAPHSLPTAARVQGQAGATTATTPLTVTVRGLPGVVDTSFAGGVVRQAVDIGEDYANAVAVQADGKIIVAGSSATASGTCISLVRFLRDGAVDTSFGVAGKVLTQVGARGNDAAQAVAVQPDGRIVVAGASDQGASGLDFVVLRYRADGSLDPAFGDGGKVVADFAGGTDRAWALLLQPDGKIVAGGEANTGTGSGGTGVDFALLRLNADGSPDAAFGRQGQVVTAVGANTATDVVHGLAIQGVQGEAAILAVGGDGDFRAVRYRADGALDTRFGTQGKVDGLFGSVIGGARAVTVLPTGQAVVAGQVNHHFAAVQLTSGGTLDAAFGVGGRFERSLAANWNEATALARQDDGKLILGGWAYTGPGSSGDFAALRLAADGTVDTAFGDAGVTIIATAPGTKDDQGRALALQPDERVSTVRVLQAGPSNDSNHDFALLRLWL